MKKPIHMAFFLILFITTSFAQDIYGSRHFKHEDVVRSVAIASHGPYDVFFVTGDERSITLWETQGTKLRTFREGLTNSIYSIRVAPDLATMVVEDGCCGEAHIRVLDVETGKQLYHFDRINPSGGDFSYDGRRMAFGNEKELIVVNTSGWGRIHTLEGHQDYITSVVFSLDGDRIITSSMDQTIRVWNSHTGAALKTYKLDRGFSKAFAVDFDLTQLIVGTNEGYIYRWNMQTDQLQTFKEHNDEITSVEVAADGSHFYTASLDGTVKKWGFSSSNVVKTYEHHNGPVFSFDLASNSFLGISGGADKTMRAWEVDHGFEVIDVEGHLGIVSAVCYSGDKSKMVSGGEDQSVILWDANTKQVLRSWKVGYEVTAVAFDDRSNRVAASAGGEIYIWNAETGANLAVLRGHRNQVQWLQMETTVYTNPHGDEEYNHYIYSSGWDKSLRKWNVDSQSEMINVQLHSGVDQVVVSGNQFVLGYWDGEVSIHNRSNLAQTSKFKAHNQVINGIQVYGPGLVTTSEDGNLKIWTNSGQEILSIPVGSVNGLATIGDVAMVALSNRKVALWSLTSREKLKTIDLDAKPSVILSKSGNRFAVANIDGTIYEYSK